MAKAAKRALRDHEIREAAHATLMPGLGGAGSVAVHDELPVGNCRVDLAVVGDDLHGFEIKSERDVLDRLKSRFGGGQIREYSAALDRVTVLTAGRHLAELEALVPAWWGLTLAAFAEDGSVAFTTHRPALPNPEPDSVQIAWLLQRPELERLFWRHGIRGYSRMTCRQLSRTLAERLPLDQLRADVRDLLRQRPSSPRPLPHEQKTRRPRRWDGLGRPSGALAAPLANAGTPWSTPPFPEPILFEPEGDARCVAYVAPGHHAPEAFLAACRSEECCSPVYGVTPDQLRLERVRLVHGRFVGLDEDDPRSPFQECPPGLFLAKPFTVIAFRPDGIMPYHPLPGLNEPPAR